MSRIKVNNNTGIITIPVTGLASGLYFLKLNETNGSYSGSFKFIKQ